jgi:hypothetical protein
LTLIGGQSSVRKIAKISKTAASRERVAASQTERRVGGDRKAKKVQSNSLKGEGQTNNGKFWFLSPSLMVFSIHFSKKIWS